MFKSNGGFTLVELIVVIAILGILSVVAVPSYTAYINKAKDAQKSVNSHYNYIANEINEAVGETFATVAENWTGDAE